MESYVVYKKFVMFSDLNPGKKLYGGTMMSWVDEAAAIFAYEQLGREKHFVTLKISEVLFDRPAGLGDLLTFYAGLCNVGRTSFEVSISVRNRDLEIVSCEVTFVALDKNGKPVPHGLAMPK
ncbi:MAG: acyl-CoA thioesterase [Deltaproteobacteria bacterium]|nr:acyl-CoA thioesterase [Deltaproteobacteria bacterium]